MTGLYQNPCYCEACYNGVKCTKYIVDNKDASPCRRCDSHFAEAGYGYAGNQR